MVAAIGAAQGAALIAAGTGPWTTTAPERNSLLGRLLLPHATALAVVTAIQLALPSTLVPRYSGNGISNVWRLADDHLDHLAEVSGFKHSWADDPTVLGSTALGWVVTIAYLLAALGGIVLAVTRFRVRDLHLVAYAVVAFAIGGSFRSAINRYVATVAPLLLLLGLAALHTLVTAVSPRRSRRWAPAAVVTLVVAAIAAGNLVQARDRVERSTDLRAVGAIEWGPTHPDALALFDIVRDVTDPDDSVAAPKARAMTLETGRRSVQVDDYRPIPIDVPIALIVAEVGSELASTLTARADEFSLLWGNTRFRVFQPKSAASASTNGAGSSSTASP
jgi:hypothetical protein